MFQAIFPTIADAWDKLTAFLSPRFHYCFVVMQWNHCPVGETLALMNSSDHLRYDIIAEQKLKKGIMPTKEEHLSYSVMF